MRSQPQLDHTLVKAARAFLEKSRLSAQAREQFHQLVTSNISQLAPRDQRALCALLASSNNVPSDIMIDVCLSDSDGSEALAARGLSLSEDVAIAIIEGDAGKTKARAIARRSGLSPRVISALRAMNDAAVDRSIELRQLSPTQPVLQTAEPAPLTSAMPADSKAHIAEMVSYAQERDYALLATAIADRTGLSLTSAETICDFPFSRNFVIVLKFLDFSAADAQALFVNLTGIGRKERTLVAQFDEAFSAMTKATAASRIRAWQLEELESLVKTTTGRDQDNTFHQVANDQRKSA